MTGKPKWSCNLAIGKMYSCPAPGPPCKATMGVNLRFPKEPTILYHVLQGRLAPGTSKSMRPSHGSPSIAVILDCCLYFLLRRFSDLVYLRQHRSRIRQFYQKRDSRSAIQLKSASEAAQTPMRLGGSYQVFQMWTLHRRATLLK